MEISHLIRGVEIKTIARIKPPSGKEREDLRIANNKITLLDLAQRIRDEFSVDEVSMSDIPNQQFYAKSIHRYLRYAMEGYNISFFTFGSTGSGKTHTFQGGRKEAGIVTLLVENLVADLLHKEQSITSQHSRSETYSISMRMRLVEIVEEDIRDLLIDQAVPNMLQIYYDDVEGVTVRNATWRSFVEFKSFLDIYWNGIKNRTGASNQFGNLSAKSTCVLTLQIVQNQTVHGEPVVYSSYITFVDCPGSEVLEEDFESLRMKQGGSLNQGIIMLSTLLEELSHNKGATDSYEHSATTLMCKEMLGGNSISVGIFNLQYDDQVGSMPTLKALRNTKQIINFPVVNDCNSLGLMRKLRQEISQLRSHVGMSTDQIRQAYELKIAELETKLVKDKLDDLKVDGSNIRYIQEIKELKDKFNAMVKGKSSAQAELIRAEEEKLQLSKALIDMQIDNSKLLEDMENHKFNKETNMLNLESGALEHSIKEDKASKLILELQHQVAKYEEEKHDLEIEFVSLKKNFHNKVEDVRTYKSKVEGLSIEIINLVNENKSLMKNSKSISGKHGAVHDEYQRSIITLDKYENEIRNLKEAIILATAHNEDLKAELVKGNLREEQTKIDFEGKKVNLEREYLGMTQKKSEKIESLHSKELDMKRRNEFDRDMNYSEKMTLQRRFTEGNRKIDELVDELKELKEQQEELRREKRTVDIQLEEMREGFRNKLGKLAVEQGTLDAKGELIRNFKDQERQNDYKLQEQLRKMDQMKLKIRGLRAYARNLRNCAEDLLPPTEAKPDILLQEPPEVGGEDDMETYVRTISNLKKANEQLQVELKRNKVGKKGQGDEFQRQLLREIQALKAERTKEVPHRPQTGEYEMQMLKKERNELREEVAALKQLMENDSAAPTSGQTKQLKQKIFYLEKSLMQVERERSELSVRATMAEEQFKTMEAQLQKTTLNYQKKIAQLTKAKR